MSKSIRRQSMPQVAAAIAVATFASGSALPAAASEIQDAYRAHTKTCIGLFFSDKAAHSAQCLPNMSANIPAHDGSGTGVAAPPPPPVIAEDPDVDSSYPDVDSSYPQA